MNTSTDTDRTEDGWEKHFGDHIVRPVFGTTSVGVDISFYSSQQLRQLYGLPDHVTDFVSSTMMKLNDGIKVIHIVGAFWHNPSERLWT